MSTDLIPDTSFEKTVFANTFRDVIRLIDTELGEATPLPNAALRAQVRTFNRPK
jgi:hypothetical protein